MKFSSMTYLTGNFVFSTLDIFNTCSACLQTKKLIAWSNWNGLEIFAIMTYLNKDVGKYLRDRKNKNFHVLQILCQFSWVHYKFFGTVSQIISFSSKNTTTNFESSILVYTILPFLKAYRLYYLLDLSLFTQQCLGSFFSYIQRNHLPWYVRDSLQNLIFPGTSAPNPGWRVASLWTLNGKKTLISLGVWFYIIMGKTCTHKVPF